MGWWYGGGWFNWIFLLLFAMWIFRIFWWGGGGWGYGRRYYRRRGYYGPWGGDPAHAEDVLRERFARGEIDEAEYERLLEVLRRSH